MTKQQFNQFIGAFDFTNLFNQLGWNYTKTQHPVKAGEQTFVLQSVAQKSNFKIFVCEAPDGDIPDYATRKKLDTTVTKLFAEHLIIFIDKNKTHQLWQVRIVKPNKPVSLAQLTWNKGQAPELLWQKVSGLLFTIDEEENITIIDVSSRVNEQFTQNNERVTKQFYDRFKDQHKAFLKFIKGIEDKVNQEWYASLMLNRLMFCYFIQKKGFLDNNRNYLSDKLKACQEKKGKDKFYNFYRDFLLKLFHKGLNEPNHSEKLIVEIGNIPYLNGGLFDEHDLEKSYDIQINDKAFDSIFNFFNEWEWHLDTRHTASGKDINPDVIGYIFEKYINDRADMGAYYTKEDITDYISKNCILPFLFDETKRQQPKAFDVSADLWQQVKESGDKYIYEALKKGTEEKLPKEIADGIKNVAARTEWNKPSPEEFALPTEIWREVVDRRNRYEEVKTKIEKGEVTGINDFITYNLNIRQFAIDCIANTNDPEWLKGFYKALSTVTIIDPTCGSGAFLFAVMNILEELYEACLQRMRIFIEEEDGINKTDKKTFNHKYKYFREVLNEIQNEQHPNLSYFIYKSIILRNLYGVDIMKEAVEIAKLRLFLKLVATVEPDYKKENLGLEPLPDIDFNIRSGNTLVGFATEAELKKGLMYTIDGIESAPVIEEKCEVVAKAFARYKEIQLSYGEDYEEFKKAKDDLRERLQELNHELNLLLYKQAQSIKFEKWIQNYKPFHWFAEFYEIMKEKNGFDIIIGNPPYIAMKKINYDLRFSDFKCSDLFGFVIRRCSQILNKNSRYGFIVMHNLAFSRNFADVRRILKANATNAWFSFFGRIPAGLFSGDVRVRNCIFLLDKSEGTKKKNFYTTRIHRWFSDAREQLFPKLHYSEFNFSDTIPMFNSNKLASYFQGSKGKPLSYFEFGSSKHKLYFKQSAYNWVAVSITPAPCFDHRGKKISQSQVSDIYFNSEEARTYALLLLNGKIFFSQWLTFGDEFHLTRDDLTSIKVPFENIQTSDKKILQKLAEQFEDGLQETIQYKLNAGKNVGTFNTAKLWHITDKSDKIFLKYLCDNPDDVFEAIQSHVSQTVITVTDENDDE